VIPLQVEKL